MVSRAIAALAIWAFAASPAHAQHDHAMHAGDASRPDLGASAAFDAKGELLAVYKEGRHVMLRSSANGGGQWSAPRAVNAEPEDIAADGDSRPKVAPGANGEVYVTWTTPLAKPYTGNIRFARSTDGGATFSPPVTVHTDRQVITHRFDSVAVNGAGQVFIAWVDKRDGVAAAKAKAAYAGAAIYYAVSDDRGASFRGDFRVADHSCECCRIALVPQEDGSVVAFWRHVFGKDVRDHATARLRPDGRVEGFERATFDGWHIDACPHHGPSLAMDGQGNLHAVWFTGAEGKAGVHYGRVRGGRVEGERQVGGERAEHADIAARGSAIAIAWKEFDGKVARLRAMRSGDAGATWREVELASSEGPTDQPRVLAHGGGFVVFWNTRDKPLMTVELP